MDSCEMATIALRPGGRIYTVTADSGSDIFGGILQGEDAETGARWDMPFSLPRAAVEALAVPQIEEQPGGCVSAPEAQSKEHGNVDAPF